MLKVGTAEWCVERAALDAGHACSAGWPLVDQTSSGLDVAGRRSAHQAL